MKTIRYFIAALLFLGFSFGLASAEKPVKEKKAKKLLPEYEFKRFYVDISVGYAFRLGSNEIDGLLNTGELMTPGMFIPLDCANVGKGFRIGVNFGINFNRYVGLELGGGYMAFPVEIVATDRGGTVSAWDEGFVEKSYRAGLGLDAQRGYLSIQMKASPGFVRCNPYVKAGIGTIFGRMKHSTSLSLYDFTGAEISDEVGYRAQYGSSKNFFMLGFVGALGIDFYINPMLTFFMEWQAGVYSTSYFNWMNGKQWEEGSMNAAFAGDEDVFGNSHGLNLGIKFKF